ATSTGSSPIQTAAQSSRSAKSETKSADASKPSSTSWTPPDQLDPGPGVSSWRDSDDTSVSPGCSESARLAYEGFHDLGAVGLDDRNRDDRIADIWNPLAGRFG